MSVVQSLIVVVLFALVYAKMETMIESGGRKWTPVMGKFSTYHIWLGTLDFVVNLPALAVGLSLYLFCVLLFALLEDIFYFAWLRKRIKPDNWTVKGLPYFKIRGWIIPAWYAIAVCVLVVLAVFV